MVDTSVSWNDGNYPYGCCDGSSSTYTIKIEGKEGTDYDNLKVYYIVSTFYGDENRTSKYQNSWPILSLTKKIVDYEICQHAWEDKTNKAKNMQNILTELVNLLSEDPELPLEKMIEYLTNPITEK
jgi:hypothetical protein